MMKTTIELPDDLYRRAKAEAALSGRKLKELAEEGLRLVLEIITNGQVAQALLGRADGKGAGNDRLGSAGPRHKSQVPGGFRSRWSSRSLMPVRSSHISMLP